MPDGGREGQDDREKNIIEEKGSPKIASENISTLEYEMRKGSLKIKFKSNKSSESSWKVPQQVHFLWLGFPIEDRYLKNIRTFLEMNPDYTFYLWTDMATLHKKTENPWHSDRFYWQNIEREMKFFKNRKIIENEKHIGCKTDLLKYEIIYRHGGIYLDTDSVSVLPLPPSLSHSFVSHTLSPYYNIQSSVFGFPAGSQFLYWVLTVAAEHWASHQFRQLAVPQKFGPTFFTSAFVEYHDTNIQMISQDYLVLHTDRSILYQTMDGTWLGENNWEEREELNNFLARKKKQKIKEEEENSEEYLEDIYYYEK